MALGQQDQSLKVDSYISLHAGVLVTGVCFKRSNICNLTKPKVRILKVVLYEEWETLAGPGANFLPPGANKKKGETLEPLS